MTFKESIKTCYNKYFTLKGRASRSEYWWFVLYSFIIGIVLMTVLSSFMETIETAQLVSALILLFVTGIPSITAQVRRLHDIGRSGWWYWLCLIPFIGSIILIILSVQPSDGPNEYGETNEE